MKILSVDLLTGGAVDAAAPIGEFHLLTNPTFCR